MNIKDLRPARDFARRYGVKAIVHGAAGTGKTPIFNTAPNPILLCCEPGMQSMRNSTVPTFEASTPERSEEFFEWFFKSNEAKQFHTLGIDSGSEQATQFLWRAHRLKKDGRAAYGKLLDDLMGDPFDASKPAIWRRLFYMQEKHIYLIFKQGSLDVASSTIGQSQIKMQVPAMEGQALYRDTVHLYDLIMHLGEKNVPGVGLTKAFQTKGTNDILARDRSGMLAEFEYPDLTAIFNKAMSEPK